MEPVNGVQETESQTSDTQDQLAAFEDTIAKSLFSFGQGLVMDDLQELGNEEA